MHNVVGSLGCKQGPQLCWCSFEDSDNDAYLFPADSLSSLVFGQVGQWHNLQVVLQNSIFSKTSTLECKKLSVKVLCMIIAQLAVTNSCCKAWLQWDFYQATHYVSPVLPASFWLSTEVRISCTCIRYACTVCWCMDELHFVLRFDIISGPRKHHHYGKVSDGM